MAANANTNKVQEISLRSSWKKFNEKYILCSKFYTRLERGQQKGGHCNKNKKKLQHKSFCIKKWIIYINQKTTNIVFFYVLRNLWISTINPCNIFSVFNDFW